MKRIVILNGSPRSQGNTAELLIAASNGIMECGAEVCFYNLYELKYSGCISCFECKRRDKTIQDGECAIRDDLSEVLSDINNSDGLVVGSPIYLGDVTSATRALVERLIYPHISYEENREIGLYNLSIGMILTMNVMEEHYEREYSYSINMLKRFMQSLTSSVEVICAFDTYQFDDYSKYKVNIFSEEDKRIFREKHWDSDLLKATRLGKSLCK